MSNFSKILDNIINNKTLIMKEAKKKRPEYKPIILVDDPDLILTKFKKMVEQLAEYSKLFKFFEQDTNAYTFGFFDQTVDEDGFTIEVQYKTNLIVPHDFYKYYKDQHKHPFFKKLKDMSDRLEQYLEQYAIEHTFIPIKLDVSMGVTGKGGFNDYIFTPTESTPMIVSIKIRCSSRI